MKTTPSYGRSLAAALMLLTAVGVRGQELDSTQRTDTPAPAADQLIYKGLVGNLIETLPLDPDKRVSLQRANAVVSSPLSARSAALLLGVSAPILMIGGLIWGLWAAMNIKVQETAKVDWLSPPARGTYGLGFCTNSRTESCKLLAPDMSALRVTQQIDISTLPTIAKIESAELTPLAQVESAELAPLAQVESAELAPLAQVESTELAPLAQVECAELAPLAQVESAALAPAEVTAAK
jgi:hypothetical protein